MEDITPEQTEVLLQFQELTGINSLERCKEILIGYNWNLELAVQDFLNGREGQQQIRPTHSGHFQTATDQVRELTRPVPVNIFHPRQRIFYASATRGPLDWRTWFKWLFSLPFRFAFATVFDVVIFFYRIFVPDPRSKITDPYGDVRSFIDDFETAYGFMHPHFERSTYSQAMQKAKEEFSFLIIYLTNFKSQDCKSFNETCLLNPDVYEYINSSNVLFWGCSVEKPEGYRVSKIFRSRVEPFMAIVGLRDNKLTLVGRLEGPQSPVELLVRLRKVINENQQFLNNARRDAEERRVNRRIIEDQNDAYLESLKADQEKMKKRKEEELAKKKQQEEERLQKLIKKQQKQERAILKRTIKESFPQEPSPDEEGSLPLAFKMPSGERINRIFKSSDSISLLRSYVYCQPSCPSKFDIMKSFPRRSLPNPEVNDNAEMESTLAEFGLAKNELLFVQKNIDSETEEEDDDIDSVEKGDTDDDDAFLVKPLENDSSQPATADYLSSQIVCSDMEDTDDTSEDEDDEGDEDNADDNDQDSPVVVGDMNGELSED